MKASRQRPATEPPAMTGFTVQRADAWWVICDRCEDAELVYGSGADIDATSWAYDHVRETHPEVVR